MQVFISFPDAGYLDVVFEGTTESLVADAARSAADEWGVDAEFLELSFSGSAIPSSSRLMSHGVEDGSQLTASLLQVFESQWLTDDGKRVKLMHHLSRIGEQHLSLDTPTFATDGCFRFDMAWIPDGIEISFVNPHPSITSASFQQAQDNKKFPVSKVDLTGFSSITTIGSYFLSHCSSLSSVDLTSLHNVTKIGYAFLAGCSSLSTVDLAGLKNVTQIDGAFLAACPSLTSLDLTGLGNVTKISHSFLARCSSLSKVNVTALSPTSTVRGRIKELGF